MLSKEIQKHVFLTSFLIAVIVFLLGVMLNYSLDFVRLDEISSIIDSHEISTQSYVLEQDYFKALGGSECSMLKKRMGEMNSELQMIRTDMDHYGGRSMFKKSEFEGIRRKFFILQTEYYTLIEKFNQNCNNPFIPVLFFYKVDDSDCITQGYILEDLAKSEKNKIAVLNFDVDFKDEPLIDLLKFRYNVTTTPLVIVNDADRFWGLTYTGEINASINRQFRGLQTDRYTEGKDINFTLNANGIDIEEYVESLRAVVSDPDTPEFAKGDAMLVIGRLTGDKNTVCGALPYYDSALSSESDAAHPPDYHEENAVIYETIASIGCGRNTQAFYNLAAEEWENAGSSVRAEFDRLLADRDLRADDLKFDVTDPETELSGFRLDAPANANSFVIGASSIRVDGSDILVSQADRVTRDILTYRLGRPYYYGPPNTPGRDNETGYGGNDTEDEGLLTVFSESLTYPESELRSDIGWHEGARIKELKETGLTHHVASGTLAARRNGSWYAMNENGTFMFEAPKDKVFYPTTRFLAEDLAMIVDTHGINSIVEQAVRKNATVVVGCCDSLSKIQASLYLDKKGISVICFTDKYLPYALGSGARILGSPPITHEKEGYITLGYRPVRFMADETFVVMDVASMQPVMSYYKTPKYYFKELSEQLPLKVTYVTVTGLGQMRDVVLKAEELGSRAIAARVYNSDDYRNLKSWLEEDRANRVILFHSMAYPYGYLLLNEFPEQTTFDDIAPIFS